MESTPKPPLDRTVTSTGKTSTTPTIVPTSPKPIPVPVTLKPEPVKSILTPSVTETTLTGSEMNPLEDTGSISNVPPSTIIETTPVAETPGIPTGSGTTQS